MNVFSIEGPDVGELWQVSDFRRGCTQMHADIAGVDRISRAAIGCAFRVRNGPHAGSAETIRENGLARELGKAGLAVLQQQAIAVHYDGIVVGEHVTDLLVGNNIFVTTDGGSRTLQGVYASIT